MSKHGRIINNYNVPNDWITETEPASFATVMFEDTAVKFLVMDRSSLIKVVGVVFLLS